MKVNTIVVSALLAGGSVLLNAAQADITFTRGMPASGQANYVFTVSMEGGGKCTMNWNQSECTIVGDEIGDQLVNVAWGKKSQSVFQTYSFWMERPAIWKSPNYSVVFPTAEIDFDFDRTASEINSKGNYDIAVLPSSEIQAYGRLSNTPNSGPGYFGHIIDTTYAGGNCNGSGCTTRMLAGCYSIVMKRPHSGNPAKIYFADAFCISEMDDGTVFVLPVK